MAHRSGDIVNLTFRVDSGILLLAKHRALLERTSVNRHLADALEDYADGTLDAARRTSKVVYVFGIVQEVRELRRKERARRRTGADCSEPLGRQTSRPIRPPACGTI